MNNVLAKGPNFVFAREFILRSYGDQVWEAMIGRMSEDDGEIWLNAQLDQAFPFAAFKRGVNALTEELGSVEMFELAQMYSYIADRSLNTVYKTFFRFTSPMFVIKNYPRLWERFFSAGEIEITESSRSTATVVFNLPEIFLDWLPPACMGYSRKAVEMAGGKYFAIRAIDKRATENGSWRVSYKLSWQ